MGALPKICRVHWFERPVYKSNSRNCKIWIKNYWLYLRLWIKQINNILIRPKPYVKVRQV